MSSSPPFFPEPGRTSSAESNQNAPTPWPALLFLAAGAILSGLGVVLGAMGTHVYGQVMNAVELDIYKTGVLYQLFHGLALIATALVVRQLFASRAAIIAGWLFLAGVPFFSFSLYALALFDLKFMGAVAPVGGSLLIAGWGCLFYAAQKGWRESSN